MKQLPKAEDFMNQKSNDYPVIQDLKDGYQYNGVICLMEEYALACVKEKDAEIQKEIQYVKTMREKYDNQEKRHEQDLKNMSEHFKGIINDLKSRLR